jgi:hypothetical protein
MSRAAARAVLQKANERSAIYFAASIAGLSLILAAVHFIDVLLKNSHPNGRVTLSRNLIEKAR